MDFVCTAHGEELIMRKTLSNAYRTIERMTLGNWREELESALSNAQKQSALELAEGLKQTVRRLRQTTDEASALSLIVSSSASYCQKAAAFVFDQESARLLSSRGLDAVELAIDLKQAAAFFSAVETRDPVIAAASESELSKEFFPPAIAGFSTGEKVFLYPLVVKGSVTAVLFAMGDVQSPAMELLAEIAASHLSTLRQVALVQAAPVPNSAKRWEDLTADQQAIHLRAQRFARLKVSEMRLYHPDTVRRGMKRSDLYLVLKPEIDAARESYKREFPGVLDYLYLELVGNLANNEHRLLGPLFPGPLV
jgi:hypothetical protein